MDASERRQRASLEAAEWWVLLQSADLPRTEREQFVQWIRESPLHVEEFTRAGQIEGALAQFKRWAALATDTSAPDDNVVDLVTHSRDDVNRHGVDRSTATGSPVHRLPFSRPSGGVKRRIPGAWLGGIAATVVAVSVSVIWFLHSYGNQNYLTERAERREVALSDGSVVTMDPESQLRVEFRRNSRRVLLQKGRALFRVAKNPNRPFFVESSNTIVRAVGTQFGVDHRPSDTVVTVAEGKVGVYPQHLGSIQERRIPTAALPPTASNGAWSAEVFLTADQQVVVASPQSGTPEVRSVNSERELAWAQGLLVCDSDTVAHVIEQFNRYNRIQLHVTDPTLASRPVSGTFEATDPEAFVAFVERASHTRVLRAGNQDITLAAPQ